MPEDKATTDDQPTSLLPDSPIKEMLEGEQRHFFEAIIEGINEGVAVYDRDLRYVFVNRFFTESTGLTADQIVGRKASDVFPQLRHENWHELVERALAGDTVETGDRKWVLPQLDRPVWIRTTYGPMRSPRGDVVGVLVVARNVTERKRADEAALQLARKEAAHAEAVAAERKIRRLIESIGDPFLAVDPDGRIIYINEKAADFWSVARDELMGRRIVDAFPQVQNSELHAQLQRAIDENRRLNFEIESVITGKWIEISAYPLDGGLSIYFRNIEERKRAEEARQRYERELVAARRQAEEMERLKSSLLANMSHEIRTPLTSILLQAEVLSRDLETAHQEAIGRIVRSTERLGRTLDSVLTFAQLESGMLEPHAESIDLFAEVRQIVDELKPLADSKGLELAVRRLDGQPPPQHIRLDATLIHRIVTNLVANAIKFTESGGVTVSVRQTQSSVTLEVEDTGIGISAPFVDQVFEPFKQQSTGHGRTHEGSGLGLTITKRLIEALDGEIDVESQPGEGSRFTIHLPVQPAEVGEAPPEDIGEQSAPVAEAPDQKPLLVVDDNVDICELLELMLAPRTVHTAQSAEEGLKKAANHDYAAILMDISLPRISGVDALHELRNQDRNHSTPVIAMTGHALPGDRQRLLDEGFDAYLAKPFSPTGLDAVLELAEDSEASLSN
jgi:PAS domain S-box-containing protein